MRTPSRSRNLLGTIAFVALAGCADQYIPNTDVEDTEENREVIDFCENYRRAVERKDPAALLTLVSPDYYEDGGNSDASDDMDFAQFKAFLLGDASSVAPASAGSVVIGFRDATSIRHEIRYRRVLQEETRVFVDYTYSASYRIPTERGEDWKRKVEDNRLELVRDGNGQLRIVAGM
jgi:hypothetical protein